jgi:hypothetical protein
MPLCDGRLLCHKVIADSEKIIPQRGNLDKKLYFCSGRLCAYVLTACEDLDY